MRAQEKRVVAVTGCDSGIGKSLASLLAGKGYRVVASHLGTDPLREDSGIVSVQCDLRKEADIRRFAAAVKAEAKKCGGLYALVHNAGIAKGGPVEDTPLKTVREVMEVNYFGIVSLTQKLIPPMRRSKGRIVIHGSMAGRIALPFLSPYAASKFALEGFADSLRRELSPFGVQTALLEIAGVATPIWNKAKRMKLADFSPVYRRSLRLFLENFVEAGNRGLDREIAARRIVRIIEKKRMKPRYIIAQSTILSRLEMLIPDRLFDRLCVKLFGMDYGK